jgi:hypothetical protein
VHRTLRLSPILLAASLPCAAQEGWIALRVPSLCEQASRGPRLERLETGSHLILPDDDGERLERGEPPSLSIASLLGLLQDDISRRRLGVKLLPNAPPILVRGDAAALAGLRAALEEIDALGRALEVDVRAIWLEGQADLPVQPEAGRVEPLLARGTAVGQARLRSGARAELGLRESQSYVAGYAVEVATDAGVADPTVGSILTGRTLHLRPCRVRGGRAVHLEGFFDVARLAQMDEFDAQTPDLGKVQSPTVEVLQVAFSGVVESGGWLAVAVEEVAGVTGTLLVQATTRAEPAAPAAWRGLDLTLLETRVDELPMPAPGAALEPTAEDEPRVLREPVTSATLAQLADEAGRGAKSGLRPLAAWVPGYLLAAAGDDHGWSEVETLVAGAEQERTATYELALEIAGGRVRLPSTEGLPLRVLAGRERTLLVDYDVHVAQESWMPSPQVEHVLDGSLLQGQCSSGALACRAWRAASAEPRRVERAEIGIGALELLRRTLRSVDAKVQSGATKEILSADGPAPGIVVALQGGRT